jgi:hypothetical protein
MIKNGDTGCFVGATDIFLKETIKEILEMDMDKCFGPMEIITKATGKMVYNMGKVLFI